MRLCVRFRIFLFLLLPPLQVFATPATHPFNHVKNKIWVPEFARRWRGGLQIGPRAGNLNSSDALLVSGSSGMILHGGW